VSHCETDGQVVARAVSHTGRDNLEYVKVDGIIIIIIMQFISRQYRLKVLSGLTCRTV
jgi:hypothetical protein